MNKISKLMILSLFSLSLTSCYFNERTTEIKAGFFIGTNEYNPNETYYLAVSKLPDEQTLFSNKNTVYDVVNEKYYEFVFFTLDNNDDVIVYDFYDLKNIYEGRDDFQPLYKGNNGTYLKPIHGNYLYDYNVEIHNEEIDIYVNMSNFITYVK